MMMDEEIFYYQQRQFNPCGKQADESSPLLVSSTAFLPYLGAPFPVHDIASVKQPLKTEKNFN